MGRKKRNGGVDRLSELPDDILGHILSFLPTTKEAGRAAILSRRWRYIFAHVDTLSFEDVNPGDRYLNNLSFELDSEERRSPNGCFLDRVNAAILCRLRCASLSRNTSLRAFRVAIDQYERWDRHMVRSWVSHALQQSRQELHLDLRLHTYHPCERGNGRRRGRFHNNSDGERQRWSLSFSFPRSLFSSTALRSLRVSHCYLKPPEAIALPSLEALHLTAIGDSEADIHRLISSCPHLAELTLESCSKITRVSVLDKRLRRLALRCCHYVENVNLDASELRILHYRGAMPKGSLFTLQGTHRVHSGTIDFCGPNLLTAKELDGIPKLLENLVGAKHLHLNTSWLGRNIESIFFNCFPALSSLHKLELTGCLEVNIITRVLQQTPNLEVLSLILWHDPEYHPVAVPGAPSMLCLQQRLREISLVHYQGTDVQRMLVQLLLGNALVLQALSVIFYEDLYWPRTTLMEEIKQWVVSKSPKMIFQ
ncbi:hypothetical protein EJB05_30670, partial [Eragrostis curvula]